MAEAYDVIILGSGPAGLTAAIYTTRANLKTLCIAGLEAGGQLMLTTDVENYPGFPEGIQGPDLMELFRKQAERFGTTFVDDDATEVDLGGPVKKVRVGEDVYEGKAVILAMGAKAKWLGLDSEERLKGRGVSACATCDGFFFKDKDVVVVGGGDTAMEEALFLAKICRKVTVIHRRAALRASKIMQERARRNPKIDFVWSTEVLDVLGEDKVAGVRLVTHPEGNPKAVYDEDPTNGDLKVWEMACDGVFVAIGHRPTTDVVHDVVDLNEKGYIRLEHVQRTKVPGVFAAGDVHDWKYRQAVTAAGFGCMAALDAEKYLQSLE
jgi:thioredoxin reductase (NADPH)